MSETIKELFTNDKADELITAITSSSSSKIEKQQGVINKGKALFVGNDGNVAAKQIEGSDVTISTGVTLTQQLNNLSGTIEEVSGDVSDLKGDLNKIDNISLDILDGEVRINTTTMTASFYHESGTVTFNYKRLADLSAGFSMLVRVANCSVTWDFDQQVVYFALNKNTSTIYAFNGSHDPNHIIDDFKNGSGNYYYLFTYYNGSVYSNYHVRSGVYYVDGVDVTVETTDTIQVKNVNPLALSTYRTPGKYLIYNSNAVEDILPGITSNYGYLLTVSNDGDLVTQVVDIPSAGAVAMRWFGANSEDVPTNNWNVILKQGNSNLVNKKICAIGDSYVAKLSINTTDWLSIIASKYRATGVNLGVGGESIHTLVTNQRYTNIPSDSDYIIVFDGHNDIYTEETPLGTIEDTTNATFYGCLNILCRWILNNRPLARTLFITPTHRRPVNSEPYVTAMVQTCKKYGIPCWNAYENLGILIGGLEGVDQRAIYETRENGQYTYHLNDTAQQYLAQKIERLLEML